MSFKGKKIISQQSEITFSQALDQIMRLKQNTIINQHGKGRHDPCVVPRAVPIVEAMAAIVLADFYLLNKIY
jgi:chorismate synthase